MITFTYRYNRTVKYFRYLNLERGPNREAHHIIPRSCNGTDEQENILIVPTRWHYILHCWLPFVYLEQNNHDAYNKMLAAWHRMNNFKSEFRSDLKNLKIDSKLYEEIRLRHSNYLKELMSEKQSGSKNSNYGKHWWKDPNDRTKYKSFRDDEEIPKGWVRGKWQTYSEAGLAAVKESNLKRKGNCIWIYNPSLDIQKLVSPTEIIPEGWVLGRQPNSDKCKEKLKQYYQRKFEEIKDKKYEELKPLYDEYIVNGFKSVKEKFDYKYSRFNLIGLFNKYIPEYKKNKKFPKKKRMYKY